MTVSLYKFGEAWGISDPSPFCVKLESFLILNNIDYKAVIQDARKSLAEAPKQKLPFVEFSDGTRIGDSTLIIEELSKTHNINMDKSLNITQRGTSYAFRQMLDESFYFAALYSRWIDDKGWAVIMPLFFSSVPSFIRGFISERVRKTVKTKLYEQGAGRHTQEEIYETARKQLQSLSDLLGDNDYFFNKKAPTSLDIWCHAFIINFTRPPIETSLNKHTRDFPNLCAHAERLQALIYDGQREQKQTAA